MAAAPRSPAALPPGARTMEDVGLRHWLPHYFPVLRWLPSYNVSAQRAPPVPVGVVTGEAVLSLHLLTQTTSPQRTQPGKEAADPGRHRWRHCWHHGHSSSHVLRPRVWSSRAVRPVHRLRHPAALYVRQLQWLLRMFEVPSPTP